MKRAFVALITCIFAFGSAMPAQAAGANSSDRFASTERSESQPLARSRSDAAAAQVPGAAGVLLEAPLARPHGQAARPADHSVVRRLHEFRFRQAEEAAVARRARSCNTARSSTARASAPSPSSPVAAPPPAMSGSCAAPTARQSIVVPATMADGQEAVYPKPKSPVMPPNYVLEDGGGGAAALSSRSFSPAQSTRADRRRVIFAATIALTFFLTARIALTRLR
jgi:hypothetical protein